MDQAESSPSHPGPERRRPQRREPGRRELGRREPGRQGDHAESTASALRLDHPVIAGYDGSASSRNALAYAAGVARRLSRPLLVVYVCSSGVYCEPLTGQVVGVPRDTEALERWLLAEIEQVTGQAQDAEVDVHVRTRRGSPARELAAAAVEFTADALVIGAPTHFWHRIAGSVPGWLARHADCPVIVVPLAGKSPPKPPKRVKGSARVNRSVGEEGFEPSRPFGHTDLNRARLPFRHPPGATS
jgi:nucleotide-binding universal stress UspA family protein